jgi:glycosyltransferase involved in cell wall biosynthesis
MKKVLIFSLAYFPNHVGGAEVAIQEITDRISKDKYEFFMVCLRFDSSLPKYEKIGNVHVYRIGFSKLNPSMEDLRKIPLHLNKYVFQISAAFKAIKLHKKHKFDLVWAMMAHSCGIPAVIFKIFNKNVPYVLTLQEGDPPQEIKKKMSFMFPLFRKAFTSADIIQPISSFLEKWARDMGFKGKTVLIPNGFSPASLKKNFKEKEIEDLAKKLNKKEKDIFLVTVSRLVHKNGIDDCIKALKLLPENIKFIIVGGGPEEENLKRQVRKLNLTKRVIFIGQVNREETGKYRAVSDIFIRPSRSEGMGNSFISSMVARLPIITTHEGGIVDFIFDPARNPDKPSTGYVVDKDSPDQIAKTVKKIINNPEQAEKIVDNAYKLAFSKYDWDKISLKMEREIFDKLIKKQNGKI